MKKIFFLLLSLFGFYAAQAQYHEGMVTGNVGLGLGGFNTTGFGVPISLNVEYSLDDQLAIGGYLGYFSHSYNGRYYAPGFDPQRYRVGYSAFALGARGTFHATKQLNEWFDGNMDANKLDIYGSAMLGLEFRSYKNNFDLIEDQTETALILAPVVGARYWFTETVGGYAELGRGAFSFVTLGVSLYLY